MANDQLQEIVAQSGLEPTKATIIMDQFQRFFIVADEWEQVARSIQVTDAGQTDKMALARKGRLLLREKRIDIENTRKRLKEQALREGKAIDGIANVLKAIIVPLEEHLDKQEHFVEIKAQEAADREAARIRQEAADKLAAEEQAAREEQARIRAENERLKKEAEEREAAAMLERQKAAAEKRRLEEAAARERAKAAKAAAEQKAKAEERETKIRAQAAAAKKAADEKARKAQERAAAEAARLRAEVAAKEAENLAILEAERKEKEALEARLAAMVECPACHHKFVPGEQG